MDSGTRNRQLPLPQLVEASQGDGSFSLDRIGYLTDPELMARTGVAVAFSERTGGSSLGEFSSLNMGRNVADDPVRVEANRHEFLYQLGISDTLSHLVNPRQVHGDDILVVLPPHDSLVPYIHSKEGVGQFHVYGAPEVPLEDVECDAVISTIPMVPVMLCFADCVPIVLVAQNGMFAVVHSGWRGTLKGIAGKALGELCKLSGCEPSEVNAYIGPHIGACCYEVGEELLGKFTARFGGAADAGEQRLDLEFCVEEALLGAGAIRDRIVGCGICTAENTERFFSHRAENGNTGRFAAVACALDI